MGSKATVVAAIEAPGEQSRVSSKMSQVARRPVGVISGYHRLLRGLGRAYEHKSKNERHAWANVFMALADFVEKNGARELLQNGAWELLLLWLLESASKLTDPGGKGLPSNTWRRFAFLSLGIRALTMEGIHRKEAAQRAVQAVKGIGDARTVLRRYDELQKPRLKNWEARFLFDNGKQLLPEMVEKDGAAAVAKRFFDMANAKA